MSQFIVEVSAIGQPFQTKYNSTLYPVHMAGKLDGVDEHNVSMNIVNPQYVPQPGTVIECLIEKRDEAFKSVKIKKAPMIPGAAPSYNTPDSPLMPQPVQTAIPVPSQPGTVQQMPARTYEEPGDRQSSIERQNALTNAVTYCTEKASFLTGINEPEKAEQELTGKHIVQVATYFHKFTSGKIVASMSPDEIAEQFGYVRTVEDIVSEPLPTMIDEEIDISDLPF